jgi:hypothetical protein
MDDVLAFRNAMAESGTEYTPAQAGKVMDATEEFRQTIHDECRENPEKYEALKNLTLEERQDLCIQFAQQGQEVTLTELDELIDLTLEVYDDEKLLTDLLVATAGVEPQAAELLFDLFRLESFWWIKGHDLFTQVVDQFVPAVPGFDAEGHARLAGFAVIHVTKDGWEFFFQLVFKFSIHLSITTILRPFLVIRGE